MSNIRFGMAGLGRLGYGHAENITFKTPGVELAAVCSVVPQELERASRDFVGAARYSDYGEMLKDKSLDAIFLCTPSGLHCEQIEAGLKAGFHVGEKPLGVNVAECEHVEKVVAQHPDQVFMLGFMRRYDESYAHAKRLIDEGRIGTPFTCLATAPITEAIGASWKASEPMAARGTWPQITTIGMESAMQSRTGVTMLVAPGPEVTSATPTWPVERE